MADTRRLPGPNADVWDWRKNAHRAHLDVGHGDCTGAVFLPSTGQVVTTSGSGHLDFWRIGDLNSTAGHFRGMAPMRSVSTNGGPLHSVDASPDSTRLVTAGEDSTVALYNSATGKVIGRFNGHRAAVLSALFAQDGSRVVTASRDGTVRIWDAHSTAPVLTLVAPAMPPSQEAPTDAWPVAAVFSPDGKYVVSANTDQNGYVWDAKTGALMATLKGHTGALTAITFSPDGSQFATTGKDRTVRVWRTADIGASRTISPYYSLQHFRAEVLCVAFSPDGKWLTAAGNDGMGRVYPATLDGIVRKAQELAQDSYKETSTSDGVAAPTSIRSATPSKGAPLVGRFN